jgi:hypothetical protein
MVSPALGAAFRALRHYYRTLGFREFSSAAVAAAAKLKKFIWERDPPIFTITKAPVCGGEPRARGPARP